MSFGALLVFALGLAMDATAVAAARGAVAATIGARDVALVATLFGGFHMVMPLIGSFVGERAHVLVASWDHWIAFALLIVIGGKMVVGPRRDSGPSPGFATPALLAVGFATSIDALAVGITLPLLDVNVPLAILTIGGVTALCSAGGLFVGHRFGARVGRRLGWFGGLILAAIGTKILIGHLLSGS